MILSSFFSMLCVIADSTSISDERIVTNLIFVLPGLIGDVEPLRTTTVLPFPPFTGEPRRLPGDSGLPVQQNKTKQI